VRLAELAASSGVPVPTVKFYLREGLVPRGEGTGGSDYTDTHVARLRLIRSLTDLGGLSLARVATVLQGIDGAGGRAPVEGLLPEVADQGLPLAEVDAFLADVGLGGAPVSARRVLARTLLDLRRAGYPVDAGALRAHARAATWLVSEEDEVVGDGASQGLLASVAFGAALDALRVAARASRRGRP
jgi:DNA-binding transcriptional MerR regulator